MVGRQQLQAERSRVRYGGGSCRKISTPGWASQQAGHALLSARRCSKRERMGCLAKAHSSPPVEAQQHGWDAFDDEQPAPGLQPSNALQQTTARRSWETYRGRRAPAAPWQ